MSFPTVALWFDVLGGQSNQQIDQLRQDQQLVEFSTASNVIPDPLGKLVTRPGFSNVRSSAITNAPAIVGMFHMGDLADEFILGAAGDLYRDNANPPGAITGGTTFTSGQNVLLRGDVANDVLVIVANDRSGNPQQITASVVRSDLGGTPPEGIDYKYFGRRGFMFSPSYGGTTYRHIVSFNSSNDSATAWTNPVTTNFLNFGRPGAQVNVLGGEHYMDTLVAFTEDDVYPIYATPNATLPFDFIKNVFHETGGGPPNIHAVVSANDRLYWLSRNFDVKVLEGLRVRSIGYPVQPFLRGLLDSRRVYTIGGWEPQFRLVCWAVSDGSDTTNQDVLALQVDTGQFYFFTISINAFALRRVSGELRLIGGHYNGLFSNLFDTSTTGDLQSASAAIDGDIQTPRHHLGLPGVVKKVPYVAIEFDPIGSESVTVQYQLDDGTTWTSFSESPLSMSGTDVITSFFTIPAPFERIRLRFRDANSGERFRVLRYGFPRPMSLRTSRP